MLFFSISLPLQALSPIKPIAAVCINKRCYDITLANTPTKRRVGLMYREYMARDKGMLFTYDEPTEVHMWMKNTPLPLDIIWINKNHHIIHIAKNTTPYSSTILSAPSKAQFVLEINAGESDDYNFEIGQEVVFKRALNYVKPRTLQPSPALPGAQMPGSSGSGIPQLNGI